MWAVEICLEGWFEGAAWLKKDIFKFVRGIKRLIKALLWVSKVQPLCNLIIKIFEQKMGEVMFDSILYSILFLQHQIAQLCWLNKSCEVFFLLITKVLNFWERTQNSTSFCKYVKKNDIWRCDIISSELMCHWVHFTHILFCNSCH